MAKNVTVTFTRSGDTSTSATLTAGTGTEWGIPSDGLDGIGSSSAGLSFAEYASSPGGMLQGAHTSVVDRTVKLVRYGDEDGEGRREAEEAFLMGFAYDVSIAYKGATRSFTGYLSNMEVSSGNVYEPLVLTLTFMCEDPFLTGGMVRATTRESSEGIYTTDYFAYPGTAPAHPSLSIIVYATQNTVPTGSEEKDLDPEFSIYRTLSRSVDAAGGYVRSAYLKFDLLPFYFGKGETEAQTRVTVGWDGGGMNLKIEEKRVLSSGRYAWVSVTNPYRYLVPSGTGLRGMMIPPGGTARVVFYIESGSTDPVFDAQSVGEVTIAKKYTGM